MKLLYLSLLAASVGAATIRIDVGQSGFTFSPSTVNATAGDMLEFHFHALNHSVVQGDFSDPCTPVKNGGFFSGFMPTSSGENAQVFQVRVNSTDEPIFFYCSQNTLSHCKNGMSGVVNPSADESLATYQSNAQSVSTAVSPDTGPFGGVLAASSGGSPTTTTSSAPGPTTSCPAPKSGGGGGYRRRDTACPSGASSGASLSIAAVVVAAGMALMMA